MKKLKTNERRLQDHRKTTMDLTKDRKYDRNISKSRHIENQRQLVRHSVRQFRKTV